MQPTIHIGFIGAGKVATQLATALHERGCIIDWVWSRTPAHAQTLAGAVAATSFSSLEQTLPATHLIILSVPDDVVFELSHRLLLAEANTAVVHTSGSLDITKLTPEITQSGVFYPLQTFSPERKVSFSGIPICIEASNANLKERLNFLADLLGGLKVDTTAEQRMQLHIAAVFACNFTNFLYACSEEIMQHAQLPFELLHPLMQETVNKAIENKPSGVQTGPAFRNDVSIMNSHISWLTKLPELQALYVLLSKGIIQQKKSHE
jgi:predicted short-subunit dehydrogenase-like oxidoreductase (DUF2520 family)